MDIQLCSSYENSHSIAGLKNEECSVLESIPKTVNTTAMQFSQALDGNVTMQYAVPSCDFDEKPPHEKRLKKN